LDDDFANFATLFICRRQKRDLASRDVDISASEAQANAADADNEDDAVDDRAQQNPNICLV